ncbi:SHOCT domain-containing protein [Candidatus Pelagibacter sp.]|nr:SHOCT domain-containing protein [Candidatus Pelagibacter sp.]
MEKLIFFGLVIPILFFVLYLGTKAIMSGVSAKQANQVNKEENEIDDKIGESNNDKSLSEELEKLSALRESGVLTQEEFEKAKNKLLNN